jgi:hypothetical protein
VTPQTDQYVRNEWLFRQVNERIAEVSEDFELDGRLEFLCECGRERCLETISLSRHEYEGVRDDGTRFVVKNGHEDATLERVVVRGEGFLIVEKIGSAGEDSEEQAPAPSARTS